MSNNPVNLNVAGLDERQVAVRNRSGFWAWLLLVILLFANGWINDSVGRWGSGLVQALTLFFASALFFTCRAIWAGAHWSSGTQGRRMLVLFGVTLAGDVALFAWKLVGVHRVSVWQGRAAGDDFLLVVETIFIVVVAATMALRLRLERREELAEDAE